MKIVETIKDLDGREDLMLIQDSQDRYELEDYLGLEHDENDGYFVKQENGDYTEVYAFYGFLPEKNKHCIRII